MRDDALYKRDNRVVTYTKHKSALNRLKGKGSLSGFVSKIIDMYIEATEKRDAPSDE